MGSLSIFQWLLVAFVVWLLLGRPGTTKKSHSRKTINFQTDAAPIKPDAIEGSFWDVSEPKPSDIMVHLVYKDGQGLRTRRTVNVNGFGTKDDGYFSAQCMMRNGHRTFMYKRVEQAIDPATGEIINDLPKWLHAAYISTPQGKASKIAFENLDLLKTLLYVAKADGRMTTAEIAAISATASDIVGKVIDVETIKIALNTLSTPSFSGYKLAVGRLIKQNRTIADKVFLGAKDIVNTQKTTHADEQAAIAYFESKLLDI